MNKSISKLLIFLIIASFGVIQAYGETEAEQSVETDVQPAVSVDPASTHVGTQITDVLHGIHSGLTSIFNIKTNGAEGYEFVMSATTNVDGNTVSAYMPYSDGAAIIFARDNSAGDVSSYPTLSDYYNIKSASKNNNRNIIAYPVSLTLSDNGTMQKRFESDYKDYEHCFVIDISDEEGSVTHYVQGEPLQDTYSIEQDQAGTYRATVTLSALKKY